MDQEKITFESYSFQYLVFFTHEVHMVTHLRATFNNITCCHKNLYLGKKCQFSITTLLCLQVKTIWYNTKFPSPFLKNTIAKNALRNSIFHIIFSSIYNIQYISLLIDEHSHPESISLGNDQFFHKICNWFKMQISKT
mgnify:CR=1 FL=1